MQAIPTDIPGVVIVEPEVFEDRRGYFFETYRRDVFESLGITATFVQDNQSGSCRDTLRGLHYQLGGPQAKLCRVIRGEILDVVVDIRRGSPTFLKWVAVALSDENRRQLFVPRGFAHGFAVRSSFAEVAYKCDDFYRQGDEYGIRWNDPRIGVEWGIREPILSGKDAALPLVDDVPEGHFPRYEADGEGRPSDPHS